MAEKRALYFAAGAEEIWICDRTGVMTSLSTAGIRKCSALCPDFPVPIELR